MSNVAFLLVAVGASVVGSIVLWLRTRKPTTVGSSIDSFAREMRALAPDHPIVDTTEPVAGFRALSTREIEALPADPPVDDADRADTGADEER